jgi:hypothetical protein
MARAGNEKWWTESQRLRDKNRRRSERRKARVAAEATRRATPAPAPPTEKVPQ